MATRYVTDEQGERVAVMLDLKEYEDLLEQLEDLEATLAYDRAIASGEEAIPLDQAFAEIDREQRAG